MLSALAPRAYSFAVSASFSRWAGSREACLGARARSRGEPCAGSSAEPFDAYFPESCASGGPAARDARRSRRREVLAPPRGRGRLVRRIRGLRRRGGGRWRPVWRRFSVHFGPFSLIVYEHITNISPISLRLVLCPIMQSYRTSKHKDKHGGLKAFHWHKTPP